MKRYVAAAAALLVAYVAGLWSNPGPDPAELKTDTVTVAPPEMTRRIAELEIEVDGWKARAEGAERRPPRLIVRTDTLIPPPDTVLRIVTARGGDLAWAPLLRRDSLWAPELHRASIADCDDGWSVGPSGLVCDRARLGHLYVGATSLGSVGARWMPRFRSRWSVELGWLDRPFIGANFRVW